VVTELESLAGSFLIAMPSLADPNFWRSVVLLGVHSREEGAFGLVINRALDLALSDVLEDMGESPGQDLMPLVLGGGPVDQSHGFVLFETESGGGRKDEQALGLGAGIALSGSAETLSDLAHGRRDGRFYLLLGYAGWAPGQLEREIEENSWVVAPLEPRILFDVPFEERWTAALRSIGVDPGTLVDTGSSIPS
jgi:putative transcriptional regulator